MKNGLVSTTEKSLKDAVISLRKDMTDVTLRIKDLEQRLNQLTRVQNKDKVMVSTIYTDCIPCLNLSTQTLQKAQLDLFYPCFHEK